MKLNLLKNNWALAIILLTACAFNSYGQKDTTTIVVTQDVYASQKEPAKNFDGITDLGVAIDESGDNSRETYLMFDLTDMYGKGGLVKVALSIASDQKNDGGWTAIPDFFINVFGCENAWDETSLTWEARPKSEKLILAEANINQGFKRYELTGTLADTTLMLKYITNAMKAHLQYVSFVIKGKEETSGSRIWLSSIAWEPARLIVVQDPDLEEPGTAEISQHDTTTVVVAQDVYASQKEPAKNLDGITDLGVAIDETNGDSRETYLMFDIYDIYGKGGLVKVALSIASDQKNDGGWTAIPDFPINVFGCDNSWDETSLTWDARPKSGELILAEANINQGFKRYELTRTKTDTTLMVKYIAEAMKAKLQFVSFVIKGKEETTGSRIWLSSLAWEPARLIVVQDINLEEPGATGISVPSTPDALRVYPNPVGPENELTVSLATPNAKVAIFNSIGQKMMEKLATGNIAKFNVNSLPKGIYVVRLSDGTNQKFIK